MFLHNCSQDSYNFPVSSFHFKHLCQIFLMCVYAQLLSNVLTVCDPIDCCLSGSFVCGVLQARIPEWIAISYSRESSWTRDWSCVSYVSCVGRQILYHGVTWEVPCFWPFLFIYLSYFWLCCVFTALLVLPLVEVHRFLIVAASPVAEYGL